MKLDMIAAAPSPAATTRRPPSDSGTGSAVDEGRRLNILSNVIC